MSDTNAHCWSTPLLQGARATHCHADASLRSTDPTVTTINQWGRPSPQDTTVPSPHHSAQNGKIVPNKTSYSETKHPPPDETTMADRVGQQKTPRTAAVAADGLLRLLWNYYIKRHTTECHNETTSPLADNGPTCHSAASHSHPPSPPATTTTAKHRPVTQCVNVRKTAHDRQADARISEIPLFGATGTACLWQSAHSASQASCRWLGCLCRKTDNCNAQLFVDMDTVILPILTAT